MRAALARRGDDAGLEPVLDLDARWRELTQELEAVQAELNEASRGRTGRFNCRSSIEIFASRSKPCSRPIRAAGFASAI